MVPGVGASTIDVASIHEVAPWLVNPNATASVMTVPAIINAALTVSIFLGVLAVGLRVQPGDLTYLLRRPSRLAQSQFAMNVLWPIAVLAVCRLFSLHPAVIVALVTLSIAPVGALFPAGMMSLVAPDKAAYARGLFFASIVLSVVLTPLAVEIIQIMTGGSVHVRLSTVAEVAIISVLLPLGIGLTIGRRRPAARRWIPAIQRVSSSVLALCTLVRLAIAWPYMGAVVRQGTLAAIALMTLIGLAIGHVLGGSDEDDRTVLAFATVSRHPGVALTVASLTNQSLAPVGVLLASAVGEVAALPYKRWRRRRQVKTRSA